MRGKQTGIGVYTENLIRALRQFAPEIEIIELDDGAEANQRTDRRILREQLTLPRLARQSRADILHKTGFGAPIRATCPVIMTVMDLIGVLFSAHFPIVSRFYWSRYLPFTLRFPTRLITLSDHTRQDIVRLTNIPASRVRVIPPGRDERFRPISDTDRLVSVCAKFNLPQLFFLFVGTLEPRKGIDTLIVAFARVAKRSTDDLVIVGKRGWGWEQFAAQIEKEGLPTRVRFLDYVAHDDLVALYNLARGLVFPSRYEGFGLPPLEAMACGTPVICSNAASLPEVVGDAALLVAPDDVEEFVQAMHRIVHNENLRRELSTRGLAQSQKFSWERAARETFSIYSEIVGS